MKKDDKRIDDDSILGDSERISETSSTNSGTYIGDETDSEYIDGEEIVNKSEGEGEIQELQGRTIGTLPTGCNVFYGTYIDNYNGTTRTRYYLDSYGQLVTNQTVTNATRPTGTQCITEMPMSHNMDMGIIIAEACAAIAIWLAVKFVLGRLIK